ncbi:MAG: hypothetical protein AAF772_12385, partial [Acidobacteriota bacterium]
RPFPPDGHLAQQLLLDSIDAETVVQRRDGLMCMVDVDEEGANIYFSGNSVNGPERLKPIFEFVRDQKTPFRVGDLPGLDAKSCIILCRRLIREGLLRAVDASAASDAPAGVRETATVIA